MAEQNKVISAGAGIASLKGSTGQPLPVAVLTDLSIDRSWTTKELEDGDKLEALDVMVTEKKVTLKAKCNAIYAQILGALVGGTVTTGGDDHDDETVTLSASVHSFTTTHSAATPVDRGVILANGSLGKLVASAPMLGEYTFAAGTWTFNNSEVGEAHCLCSFQNPNLVSVTEGSSSVGDPTYLEIVSFVTYKNQKRNIRFPKVMVTKVSESGKNKEHTTYDVDFIAYKDTSVSPPVLCKTSLSK